MTDELIRKYAREIERIIEGNTMGDFTWEGLLFSFLREIDESRTLKYEVETVEGDTVDTFSVLENVTEPDENTYNVETYNHIQDRWVVSATGWTKDSATNYVNNLTSTGVKARVVDGDENRYYDVLHKVDGVWLVYKSRISYQEAQRLLNVFSFESEVQIVDHGTAVKDDEPEKTYDVHVHDGWWRLLASNVRRETADSLVKGLQANVRYQIEEHDNGGPIYGDDDVPDGCDKW